MAEEGRSSKIFMTSGLRRDQRFWRNAIRAESPTSSPSVTERAYQYHKSEEDCTTRATIAGKELLQKQKLQLAQLVHLLKKIETQVNSSQNNMFQAISDHQASMHKLFQKSITYISAIYQSDRSHDAFLVTLKILKAIYSHICDVLGSVEGGVDELMHELAQLMCNPMVDYVEVLKDEITTGACTRLLAIVEEMGGAIKDGRLKLEEARLEVRGAEGQKVEALSRLEESEERVRKMKMQLGYVLQSERGSMGHYTQHKFLSLEEDQTKDDEELWNILKKKRRYQPPDSPFGPNDLLCFGTHNKHHKSTRGRSSISCKSIARSCVQGLSPQTPHLDSWIPLGSSPSATTQKCLSRKRITP